MTSPSGWNHNRHFSSAIGEIIVWWGDIDALLTQTCKHLYEELSGHPSEKEAPRELQRRIRFICKCCRAKPDLRHLSDLAYSICASVKDIAKHRDFFVHGSLTAYVPRVPAFQFTRLDRRSDKQGYEEVILRITGRDLLNVSEASFQVIPRLVELGDGLRQVIKNKQTAQKR